MCKFKVEYINGIAVVFPTSYAELADLISDVEKELSLSSVYFQVVVVFDLLLTHGLSSSRFIGIPYVNLKLDVSNAVVLMERSDIVDISWMFYGKRKMLIDNMPLSRVEKFKIRGLCDSANSNRMLKQQ